MITNNWFGDKSHQVTTDGGFIVAFGVYIDSRYCQFSEIVQMLNFCHGLAVAGIEAMVKDVFL